MNLSVVDRNEIDPEHWDQFILSDLTSGEFINTRLYLSYHPEGRFRDFSCAVIDKGSREILCVFPATEDPLNPGTLYSHMGTSFAGPIIRISSKVTDLVRYLELVSSCYKAKGFRHVVSRIKPLKFWPENSCCEDLNWVFCYLGYVLSGYSLGNVISFEPSRVAGIDECFSSKRRNQYKKSLKRGFLFREESLPSEVSWISLTGNLKNKFSSHPTHSLEEIISLKARFPQNIRFFYVYSEGVYASMAVVYLFKKIFHTQYLDLDYRFSSEGAHQFLVASLIQRALDEGFSGFSFGLSTEKGGKVLNEGLYSYKRQYGGSGSIFPEYSLAL